MVKDRSRSDGRELADGRPGMVVRLLGLLLIAGISLVLSFSGTGCAHTPPSIYGKPGVAPSPKEPWTPPRQVVEQNRKVEDLYLEAQKKALAQLPDSLQELLRQAEAARGKPDSLLPRIRLDLPRVVDIALRGSAQTRLAWAQARAAAAAYGSRRGQYFPEINGTVSVVRQKGASSSDRTAQEQRTYGGSADLGWLLFNFGGRQAGVEEMRQALIAADWGHNAAIQNVVLQVEEAYYDYIAARSLLASEEASLDESRKNLESAEGRHNAGLATIAEVLQARTALSQVSLSVENLRGQLQVTLGGLLTAMGIPANIGVVIDLPPVTPPEGQLSEDVEAFLERASRDRPELAAARAEALRAEAHIRSTRSQGLPSLSTFGTVGRIYRDNPDRYSNTYSAGIQLQVPIFAGFSHDYDLLQAREEAEAARAQLKSTEQQVILQVWSSYYGYRTAETRLSVIGDLMRSATESRDVALGRYQAGVGTILELLSAQSALEDARAQQARALSDYYISLAQLAHDAGALDTTGALSPAAP